MRHVLVVGAGIIGASIAWHLARRGARVTILDGGEPGGAATRASFAWINASWGNPEPYFRLRVQAMEDWRRIELEVPDLGLSWCGALVWDLAPDRLEAFRSEHTSWGYDIRRVDRERIQQIEPQIGNPPEMALHAPLEGTVEPLAAARAMLHAAQAAGAAIVAGTAVRALCFDGRRVAGVETDAAVMAGDEVVVAAGTQSGSLAQGAGIPLKMGAPAGLLIRTVPRPRLLNGVVIAPGIHVRQAKDGRLVAGTDFGGADPGADADAAAAALFERLKAFLVDDDELQLDGYLLGARPTPADGLPVVGRPAEADNVYLAVSHSGVTLAPAIGRMVADEILTGRRDELLRPFGPGRQASVPEVSR